MVAVRVFAVVLGMFFLASVVSSSTTVDLRHECEMAVRRGGRLVQRIPMEDLLDMVGDAAEESDETDKTLLLQVAEEEEESHDPELEQELEVLGRVFNAGFLLHNADSSTMSMSEEEMVSLLQEEEESKFDEEHVGYGQGDYIFEMRAEDLLSALQTDSAALQNNEEVEEGDGEFQFEFVLPHHEQEEF